MSNLIKNRYALSRLMQIVSIKTYKPSYIRLMLYKINSCRNDKRDYLAHALDLS